MARVTDRTTRVILGALIGSSLSYPELRKVAERLRFDRRWAEDLAMLIDELGYLIGSGTSMKYQTDGDEDLVEQCLSLVKRRKLPKDKALYLLAKAATQFKWRPDTKRSIRDNIESLLSRARNDEDKKIIVRNFAKKIGIEDDPYLRDLLAR